MSQNPNTNEKSISSKRTWIGVIFGVGSLALITVAYSNCSQGLMTPPGSSTSTGTQSGSGSGLLVLNPADDTMTRARVVAEQNSAMQDKSTADSMVAAVNAIPAGSRTANVSGAINAAVTRRGQADSMLSTCNDQIYRFGCFSAARSLYSEAQVSARRAQSILGEETPAGSPPPATPPPLAGTGSSACEGQNSADLAKLRAITATVQNMIQKLALRDRTAGGSSCRAFPDSIRESDFLNDIPESGLRTDWRNFQNSIRIDNFTPVTTGMNQFSQGVAMAQFATNYSQSSRVGECAARAQNITKAIRAFNAALNGICAVERNTDSANSAKIYFRPSGNPPPALSGQVTDAQKNTYYRALLAYYKDGDSSTCAESGSWITFPPDTSMNCPANPRRLPVPADGTLTNDPIWDNP